MDTHLGRDARAALQELVKGDLQEKFPDLDVQDVTFCKRMVSDNGTEATMTVEVRVPASEEPAPKKAKSDKKKKPAVAAAAAAPAAAPPAAATEKRFGAVTAPRSGAGPSRPALAPYAAELREMLHAPADLDLEADFQSKAKVAGIDAGAFKTTINVSGTDYQVVGITKDVEGVYLWSSAKNKLQMVDLTAKLRRRIGKACRE